MKNIFLHLLFLMVAQGILLASDASSFTESESSSLWSLTSFYDSSEDGSEDCSEDGDSDRLRYENYRSRPGIVNGSFLFKNHDREKNEMQPVDLADLFDFESLEERLREQFDLDDRDQIVILDKEKRRINSLEDLRDHLSEMNRFRGRLRPQVVPFTVSSSESERASLSVAPEVPSAVPPIQVERGTVASDSDSEPVTPRRESEPRLNVQNLEEDDCFEEDACEEDPYCYLPYDQETVLKVIRLLSDSYLGDFAKNFNNIFRESSVFSDLVGDVFRRSSEIFEY
jgi:hypothetical protein